MKNQWIADRGYGTGMALAFQGDVEFIRQSCNFAANFLLSPTSTFRQQTPNFVVVHTSMEELFEAFKKEGYCLGKMALREKYPLDKLEDDDIPDDIEERVTEYVLKVLGGDETAKDPTAGLYILNPKMEREAEAWALAYAEREMKKLSFEDFMRRGSREGVVEHAVSEVS